MSNWLTPAAKAGDWRSRREANRAARLAQQGLALSSPQWKIVHPAPAAVVAAPPPPPPLPPPGALIGRDTATGAPVYLDAPDLVGGLAILGKNGTGKSVTIETLAVQDMEAGRGIIVMDPHGDLTNRLLLRVPLHREQDVVFLDAGDPEFAFGINPVWAPDPANADDVSQRGDRVLEVMRKVWATSWGAILDDLIPNAAYTLLSNAPGFSLLEFFPLFTSPEFRAPLVAKVKNSAIREFWEDEYDVKKESTQATLTSSAFRRIRKFVRNPTMRAMLGQGRPTVDFDAFMAERKLVFVKLPSGTLEEEYVSLLGTLVLREVMTAAFNRLTTIPNIADRHHIVLYADEFERFATPDFGRMFREARKTGVIPIIAHQDMAQLEPKMRAIPRAARHIMTFQVSGDDATAAVGEYDATPPEGERTPVPTPYDRLLRRGHPNPKAVVLAQRIERTVSDLLHEIGLRYMASAVRNAREHLTSAINTFLFRCMATPTPEAVRLGLGELDWDVSVAFAYLRDAAPERKQALLRAIATLAQLLMAQPIYATGEMFDGKSRAEMRDDLRTLLVTQPKLHMLLKYESGERIVQRHVRVALPPATVDDPQKIARLTDLSRQRYYRRKVEVEQEIAARRQWAPEASYEGDDTLLMNEGPLPIPSDDPIVHKPSHRSTPPASYRPPRKRNVEPPRS